MLIEQDAVYTVHNAPTHLTKSYAVCTQLEEGLIACVTSALCSLAALQPSAFMSDNFCPESYILRIHSYTLLIHRRSYKHSLLYDNLRTDCSQKVWYITRLIRFFWIRSLIICSVTNSSKFKTINARQTSKESHLSPQMFH